jgi:hypothetical protein
MAQDLPRHAVPRRRHVGKSNSAACQLTSYRTTLWRRKDRLEVLLLSFVVCRV